MKVELRMVRIAVLVCIVSVCGFAVPARAHVCYPPCNSSECKSCSSEGSCELDCDDWDDCEDCVDGDCESRCTGDCETCDNSFCEEDQTKCPGECERCSDVTGNCTNYEILCFDCEDCDSNGECVDDGRTCEGCKTCNSAGNCEDDNNAPECNSETCDKCVDGICVPHGLCTADQCCDNGTCVSSCSNGKCCEDGECVSSCPTGQCCVEGICSDLCCWTLEEHPEGEGLCECIESTGNCSWGSRAWSISTCKRSVSGFESCGITYRQVGSQWACDESTDWVNLFLCYGGQASVCVSICSAESALCVASGYDPSGCAAGAAHCYECIVDNVEDPEDCGCLATICRDGDVTLTLWDNAGTLSGGSCP